MDDPTPVVTPTASIPSIPSILPFTSKVNLFESPIGDSSTFKVEDIPEDTSKSEAKINIKLESFDEPMDVDHLVKEEPSDESRASESNVSSIHVLIKSEPLEYSDVKAEEHSEISVQNINTDTCLAAEINK